jgi:hypothetical protein
VTGTYQPQPGVHVGRPPCTCSAAYRLHHFAPGGVTRTLCPTQARLTSDLTAAVAELERRPGSFIYRGEVQRLMDHRPAMADHCAACAALAR